MTEKQFIEGFINIPNLQVAKSGAGMIHTYWQKEVESPKPAA